MTPHTKHLRVFHTVAQLGSMNKAATELLRAHSAIARSIQLLEHTLGHTLFERGARGVLLTEAGHILKRRMDFALEEMQIARQDLDELCAKQNKTPRNAAVFSLAISERRLAALVALAERQHVGAVAVQLEISQPAVSIALRDLQDSIGIALFERRNNGLQPTAAGQLLVDHVKRALTQLRLAQAELAALAGQISGHVIVGALPFSRPYILPTAISNLHHQHPGLQFTTVEAPLKTLACSLWCGDIDFVIGALSPTELYPDLIQENLFDDQMGIVARKDHPLSHSIKLELSDVLSADWVLPHRGSPPRQLLQAAFVKAGLSEPAATVESSDLSIIRGLLLEGNMITAASRHLFHHEINAGMLQHLPIQLEHPARSVGILRRTPEHSSPGAQLLIEAIRRVHHMPQGPTSL